MGELGLVETISIANPLFGSKANSIIGINPLLMQEFDYLIVIDFESTCWEGEQGGWKQPEIIEFPAVLLNVHSGQLEQEFQQYQLYNRRPQGLRGALSELGINFEGREHSGLCDARNTAHLAWRIVQDGGVLKITTNISTTLQENSSPLQLQQKSHVQDSQPSRAQSRMQKFVDSSFNVGHDLFQRMRRSVKQYSPVVSSIESRRAIV
uniref:Exonuclease domain-containing protein n=1 Tax=Timema douglasi TaxID=61478 RepID=A0A7R8VSL8_TIMDO|nr:unnamed protein product [Timema douglasi]